MDINAINMKRQLNIHLDIDEIIHVMRSQGASDSILSFLEKVRDQYSEKKPRAEEDDEHTTPLVGYPGG